MDISFTVKNRYMKKLANKVALVTGGSRGIGAAIVRKLAAEGASVAFTYTNSAGKADDIVKEITSAGSKALAIQADNAQSEQVTEAVNATVSAFGSLDILVNNA